MSMKENIRDRKNHKGKDEKQVMCIKGKAVLK